MNYIMKNQRFCQQQKTTHFKKPIKNQRGKLRTKKKTEKTQ